MDKIKKVENHLKQAIVNTWVSTLTNLLWRLVQFILLAVSGSFVLSQIGFFTFKILVFKLFLCELSLYLLFLFIFVFIDVIKKKQ